MPKRRQLSIYMDDMVSPQWKVSTFVGYVVLDIQHKTLPKSYPANFMWFEDFAGPDNLLSYLALLTLGIVGFTVSNKAPINFPAMIDTITSSKTVIFSPCLEDIPQRPHNRSDCKATLVIKQPFQDHPSPVTPSQDHLLAPFQDHKQPVSPFKDHKVQIIPLHKTILPQLI